MDAALERWARAAVEAGPPSQRSEGIVALRNFPTRENVAILRSLLDDHPYTVEESHEPNRISETRRYGIRKEAFDALQAMGIETPPAVLETRASLLDAVSKLDLFVGRGKSLDFLRGARRLASLKLDCAVP